jgi:hypothetical protein
MNEREIDYERLEPIIRNLQSLYNILNESKHTSENIKNSTILLKNSIWELKNHKRKIELERDYF